MEKLCFMISLFMFLSSNVRAEMIVFEGTPIIKNVANPAETFNQPVKGEEQINYKLIITKEGDNYIWFSREKNKLKHNNDGYFDYFVRENRSDYIKIGIAPEGSLHKYLYIEHLTDGMKTITYWGYADEFHL